MKACVVVVFLVTLLAKVQAECECNCNCKPVIEIKDGCCPKEKRQPQNPCTVLRSLFRESFEDDPKLATVAAKGLCIARNFVDFVKNNTGVKFLEIKAELVKRGEWKYINVPLQFEAPFPIRGKIRNLDMSDCEKIMNLLPKAMDILPKALSLLEKEIAMLKMFLANHKDCHNDALLARIQRDVSEYSKYLDILKKVLELLML